MKKILCSILSAALLASSAVPVFAVENTDSSQAPPVLTEGTYAPNQAVVLFKDGAIDTDSSPQKDSLEPVGADFGGMMSASSSENDALAAADEEVNILKSALGNDFVLEDTLVFDNDGSSPSKAGDRVGAAKESSEEFTIALVSSDKYDTAALIEKLSRDKRVISAEPNYYIHQTSLSDYSLNDPLNRYLYDVNSPAAKNNGGEDVDNQGVDPAAAISVNASSGWAKLPDTEKETVVAVIDSGVLYTHEDLKDRMWTNPGDIGLKGTYGYDFINNDDDPLDDNDHGTHCSGIINAQANNAKGVAGVASAANVKIMALKVFGSSGTSESQSTYYQVFGAYHYIHKAVQGGVNVVAVNNSWGGANHSTMYDKLLDLVGEEGVISYLAASNEGANNERTLACPTNSESDFAVSVGAADIEGDRAAFSNYGKTSVDVFGPGMSVLSTVASDVYSPGLFDAEKLNATTEYYGEFGADVKVIDGSVTPSTGALAGDEIKSFGSLKFVKQRPLPKDDDREIPDDASLELSVENRRLKFTIKNAHCGEYYFLYFPYEKNPLTTGDDNTAFSLIAEGIPSGDGSVTNAFAGEIAEKENRFDFTNNYAFVTSTNASYAHDRFNATNNGIKCLLSAEEAEGSELGIGLGICAEWADTEEVHDTSYYLDSVAVSKPGYEIEPGTSYDYMSGTSMATPAVCGAGAMLAMIYPRQNNESGGDYARRIRAKLFSCVRHTDKLEDYCSTGGYVDLSLLDEDMPAITDAVCDLENETITLTGEKLYEGCSLTFKRMAVDGAEYQPLPDTMTVDYASDGTRLVISNAKSLFSTYTAFTVTAENGTTATGKFFLVKGQKKLSVVSEHKEFKGIDPPYLLTDADGRKLYGYYISNGNVSYYNGEQFNVYKNTDVSYAMLKYCEDRGDDAYSVYNDYKVTRFISDVPTVENGVIYNLIVLYISEKSGEESNTRKEIYLASFDLNGNDHTWHFTPMPQLPDGLHFGERYGLAFTFYNGRLICIGDPGVNESTDSTLPVYSYDSASNEWFREPDLPYVAEYVDFAQSNGKLYVMFGFDPDMTKPNEERILSSVWCFDGKKWEQKHDDLKYVGGIFVSNGTLSHFDAITPVKNGLIFINASVDGGGNMFLYNTETDEIEPLYYSVFDSLSDIFNQSHSCVTTRDGIYYLCSKVEENEQFSGWELRLLPAGSGVYEDPYESVNILGDADGDGEITITDATTIQKYLTDFEMPDSFVLKACDTNGDGSVTILDVTELQRYLADLPANENIGKPIT